MNMYNNNYLFTFFLFLLLFSPVYNLSCIIKLTCKESCSSLIKINGLDSSNTETLTLTEGATISNYKQYTDISFNCMGVHQVKI